jgi:hypothetical protein
MWSSQWKGQYMMISLAKSWNMNNMNIYEFTRESRWDDGGIISKGRRVCLAMGIPLCSGKKRKRVRVCNMLLPLKCKHFPGLILLIITKWHNKHLTYLVEHLRCCYTTMAMDINAIATNPLKWDRACGKLVLDEVIPAW